MFFDSGLNGLRKPIKKFSGGPVVKTLSSQCRVAGGVGSIPCWGTKILNPAQCNQKKKKKEKKKSINTLHYPDYDHDAEVSLGPELVQRKL